MASWPRRSCPHASRPGQLKLVCTLGWLSALAEQMRWALGWAEAGRVPNAATVVADEVTPATPSALAPTLAAPFPPLGC
jgi:hypothetical protein